MSKYLGSTILSQSLSPTFEIWGVITKYYRDRLKTHNIPNQREEFERNLEMYVNKTLTTLKDKNII